MSLKTTRKRAAYGVISVWLLFLTPYICNAGQSSEQTVKQIEAAVYDHVDKALSRRQNSFSRVDIRVSPLDARISLPLCNDPPLADSKGSTRLAGSIIVQVSCENPSTWRIHVPVTIRLYKEVLVAADGVPRKTLLTASHLMLSEREVSKLRHNYLNSSTDAIGKTLKRSVSQGTVISHGMLQEHDLIKRGDSVMIVATKKGISVRMPGVALMNGTLGNQIKVKNERSQRIVRGKITAAGEIQVPM